MDQLKRLLILTYFKQHLATHESELAIVWIMNEMPDPERLTDYDTAILLRSS